MIAGAASCAVRTDLGIEQTLNSTLNAYLRSLISLLTWKLRKAGRQQSAYVACAADRSLAGRLTPAAFSSDRLPFHREPAAAEHSAGGDQ